METTAELIIKAKNSALYSFIHKETYLKQFAQIIYLCPTNLCNHRCITCGYEKMRRGKNQRGLMSWDTFVKVVNQLPNEKGRIYLQKTGEPLLHPKIVDMMAYLKKLKPNYEIAMHTNCARMQESHIDGLLTHADFLSFSIFGFDRENYKLAHGSDDFEKVLSIIEKFHEKYSTAKRRPKVYFDVVRCSANANLSDDEIFAFLFQKFPNFNIGIHFPYNFQNTVAETQMQVAGLMDERLYPTCLMPFTMLNILWDGKIGYCVGDPYEKAVLGDIHDNTLQEIWNNDNFQEFRKAHYAGNFSLLRKKKILCGDCNWLFALKTQSTDNLCIVRKKEYQNFLSRFRHGLPVTSEENLQAGLYAFLTGDIANAMKYFSIAEFSSQSNDLRENAAEWFTVSRNALKIREHIEVWEKSLNAMGTSLRDVHISSYKINNPEAKENHIQIDSEKNSLTLKKTFI